MLHFGRLAEVNPYVKDLLSCCHGGYLWLDAKIPITIDLISQVIGLPKVGVDPCQYFKGKDNDKKLVVRLKKKYDVIHDERAYVINTINAQGV